MYTPRPKTFKPLSSQNGFTLIEMLVVIAIIALLASITVVAISRTRNRALRVQTHNNLRQLHNAFTNFAMDHRGRLPNSWVEPNDELNRPMGNWRGQLHHGGYLGKPDRHPGVHGHSILGSPIQRREAAAFTINANPPRMSTFGMNGLLNAVGAQAESNPFTFSRFIAPPRTLLLSSGRSHDQQWWDGHVAPWIIPNFTDGYVDILYADGHTGTIPLSEYPNNSVPRPPESDAWYFWVGHHQ